MSEKVQEEFCIADNALINKEYIIDTQSDKEFIQDDRIEMPSQIYTKNV